MIFSIPSKMVLADGLIHSSPAQPAELVLYGAASTVSKHLLTQFGTNLNYLQRTGSDLQNHVPLYQNIPNVANSGENMRRIATTITIFIVLSIGCFAPLAHASPVGGTPNCYLISYSYDSGAKLFTMMDNDSLLLGNTFFFESNCEYKITVNDLYTLTGPTDMTTAMEGNVFLNVQIDNIQYNVTNITSITTVPSIYEIPIFEDEYIKKSEMPSIFVAELMSNIVSIAIVFGLSTSFIAAKARRDANEQVSVIV